MSEPAIDKDGHHDEDGADDVAVDGVRVVANLHPLLRLLNCRLNFGRGRLNFFFGFLIVFTFHGDLGCNFSGFSLNCFVTLR